MDIIEQIKAAETDKERWALVIANKDKVVITLDNDWTGVEMKDDAENYTSFNSWIGIDKGINPLFEALGITAQGV
ncbi:MAG: hypothetical protein OEM38_03995 [Gammaproteobacteria bacterium]|nr:hypothetical protein [Gammaproteobacteria bacterium]